MHVLGVSCQCVQSALAVTMQLHLFNLPDEVSTVCTCCSSTSTAPKDDRGGAAGGSGRQPADPCASGSSSLTDLPLEEECSGTSRRLTVDSEEDGFSFNEDETESQEVRQHCTHGPIEGETLLVSHIHLTSHRAHGTLLCGVVMFETPQSQPQLGPRCIMRTVHTAVPFFT